MLTARTPLPHSIKARSLRFAGAMALALGAALLPAGTLTEAGATAAPQRTIRSGATIEWGRGVRAVSTRPFLSRP